LTNYSGFISLCHGRMGPARRVPWEGARRREACSARRTEKITQQDGSCLSEDQEV